MNGPEMTEGQLDPIDAEILAEIHDPVPVTFAATVVYLPILVVSILLCIFWQTSLPGDGLTPGRILEDFAIGSAVGLALVALTVFLARFLSPLRELELEFKKVLGPLPKKNIVYLALLSGLAEECCFRGWMQPWLGFVATSIIFGVLHFVPSKVFFPWTIFALGVGFVFGGLLEWRESLIAPIAAHIIVNGVNLHLIVSEKSLQPLNTPERAMDMNRDRDASEPEA